MGGKYAVIVGINYIKNPRAALKGCCNDARIMKDILLSKGFEEDDIHMIVDDDDNYADPTGREVKKALNWLCSDRSEDDVIFFHFSGHGTQVPCDGDDVEPDRKDEAIVLEQMFLMADDDLKMFFSQLPEGAKVTCITDCCHSGSMLDGHSVAIEGAKDDDSEAEPESDSLLAILGGYRDVDVEEMSVARELPIDTVAEILGEQVGRSVDPTGPGINGALAEFFGGDAGKLMVKYALSQLGGGSSSGTNALSDLATVLLGGTVGGSSGGGGGGGGGFVGAILGGLFRMGKPNKPPPPPPEEPDAVSALLGGDDPLGNLFGALGGMGLEGQENMSSGGAPSYKPPASSTQDVAILITGCQDFETSADVRPPGQPAYGALTKTLSDVYKRNPDISHYDLVTQIRARLSQSGFKQNPCLECNEEKAGSTFICD